MKKIGVFAVFAIVICLTACHRKAIPRPVEVIPTQPQEVEVSPPPPPVPAEVPSKVLEFTRTNCMGKCKNYTFIVHSNGVAEYNGKANVARMGKHFARLTPEQLTQLKKAAEAANINELSDKYPSNGKWVTDMPSVLIEYVENGTTKKIRDNYDSPKALQDFEKQVDSLIDGLGWSIVD